MGESKKDKVLKGIADFWYKNHPEMDDKELLRNWMHLGHLAYKVIRDPLSGKDHLMTESNRPIILAIRAGFWLRARAELHSFLESFYNEQEEFDRFHDLIEEFIKEMDERTA